MENKTFHFHKLTLILSPLMMRHKLSIWSYAEAGFPATSVNFYFKHVKYSDVIFFLLKTLNSVITEWI
jgi:hypothetical protein